MNTTLSAATGGLTVVLLQYAINHKYDCAALCNGILGGLVSITAGCSNVESGSAVAIGALGGCGCVAAALFDFGAGFNKHHGWGGFSATSWTEDGETKYMSTGDAIAVNMVEVCFVIAWSGGLCGIVFGALRAAKLLRISEEEEEGGMDGECASPKAYNINKVEVQEKTV